MAEELDEIIHAKVDGWNSRPAPGFLEDPGSEDILCPIISVDDHAFEPGDLFTSRVPSRLRDRVPYVTTIPVGGYSYPHWIIEGTSYSYSTADGSVTRVVDESLLGPQRLEDFRPGVYDIHARVADMDLCGIWASLCFPSMLWGFAGSRFFKMKDRDAALASVQAYNDWVVEEWCAAYPDRFIPGQIAWLAEPEKAAHEIYRNADRGFRCVSLPENPEPIGLPSIYSEHWDPILQACAETGTVVNLHVGSSGLVSHPSSESPASVTVALFPIGGLLAAVDWCFARVPIRFPDLKVVLSEAGVSWVPMILERLRRAGLRSTESRSNLRPGDPSALEMFRQAFYFCSIEDPFAFRNLDVIGEDRVMVETDYPHGDTTWPAQQALLRSEMQSLEPRLIRKVCYENAAALYRWPTPPAAMFRDSSVGTIT